MEAKNFNPLGYLDTIGGGKQRSERMVEGIFFDKGGPYQRRTHGCWSLRFLKNCTGRLLGLIMRANPPFASLCASITDPLYVGSRSDASFFLLTVSWMRLDGADWVTEARYESWHVRGIYFWQVRNRERRVISLMISVQFWIRRKRDIS